MRRGFRVSAKQDEAEIIPRNEGHKVGTESRRETGSRYDRRSLGMGSIVHLIILVLKSIRLLVSKIGVWSDY